MAINSAGPFGITDATNTNTAQVSPFGELSIINDVERRIQELMLLMQQSQLLTLQLSKENTSRYTVQEIR